MDDYIKTLGELMISIIGGLLVFGFFGGAALLLCVIASGFWVHVLSHIHGYQWMYALSGLIVFLLVLCGIAIIAIFLELRKTHFQLSEARDEG